jgi:hypothetical protein
VQGEEEHAKDLNNKAADAGDCLFLVLGDFVYLKHDVD